MKTKLISKKIEGNIYGYLFISPWLFLFLFFVAYPFLYGIIISFYEFNYIKQTFIGLKNFVDLMKDHAFWNAIVATFKITIIIIPATLAFSFWVANVINNRSKEMQAFTRCVFYLTAIVSEVALVIVWKWIFNPGYGLSVSLTGLLGIDRIDWLGDIRMAIPLVAGLVVSCAIPQPIILFSAAMNSIPQSFYEAADIDGATKTSQFFRITLPLLKPTTTFVMIVTTIASLQIFAVPYLLTAGGPNYGTSTVLLMIYKNAFEYGKYGYASAMGICLFAIIAILAFFQFKFSKSDIEY